MFEKLVSFTKTVSMLSDKPALTSTELKSAFDAAPDEVRVYLNKLIDAIKSTASGDSGAKNTGATTIAGLTGTDVQSLLESLKTYSDGKFVSMAGQKIEVVEGTATVSGTSPSINMTITFSTPYTSVPDVFFSRVTQTVSYADVMLQPFISGVATTGFSCKFTTYNTSQNFSAGTFKAKFIVIGK